MVEIRSPGQGDETMVRNLMSELGYECSIADVRARLDALADAPSDPVLLATEDAEVLGLIALHWTRMLHIDEPVARITALIVRDDTRGKGIGRALVDAGMALARQAGCGTLELTTSLRRKDAHAFYTALGFTTTSLHLHRSLTG